MTGLEEIKLQSINPVDKHFDDLVLNKAEKMFEIEDFANLLFISPTHLSNTIKDTTSVSACGIFQLKIMERALRLLANQSLSIKEISLLLTYEPSQFTKWFKRITNLIPKQYRFQLSSAEKTIVNSEMMTTLKKYADIALSF
jgi:AraC family transcriptional regulator, regulatory protein of adaptative response / methylphosphotriester-DNA alkyltransferase methyltransferase